MKELMIGLPKEHREAIPAVQAVNLAAFGPVTVADPRGTVFHANGSVCLIPYRRIGGTP